MYFYRGSGGKLLFKITKQTKAIYSCETGYFRSKILEGGEELCSVRYPTTIIDASCIFYGSSLKGREEASEYILKTKSKLPVEVDPVEGIYFFPTLSKRNKDCVWLSYYQIDQFEQIDNRTLVKFKDGTTFFVKVSKSVFDLQFKRTSQLIAQLNRGKFFGPPSIA